MRPNLASGQPLSPHKAQRTQHLAIRYTDRLLAAGIDSRVGRRGDAYDNALAECLDALFKAEVIHHEGPWQGLEDVEYATLERVAWYNSQRLREPLGYIPPAEYEEQHHRAACPNNRDHFCAQADQAAAALNQPSLRKTRGDSGSGESECHGHLIQL